MTTARLGRVVQVNVNPQGGVPKHAVAATEITAEGVAGDRQRDRRHHGGPQRAVSLFAMERIEALRAEGHPIAPGSTGDLFFSEYVEGSGNNKALEIYNPLPVAVNLADYTVRLYNNGAATPNTSLVLGGTLAPGAALVIANPSAGAALLALAQRTSGVCGFNGDDALVLEKGGVVVDAIGQVGFDPGTQWSAGGVGTLDRTLRRKAGIMRGDATATDGFDPSLEWDGFAIDDFSGLGLR